MHWLTRQILTILMIVLPQMAATQQSEKWVVSWVASAQGPYPVGIPSAQPDQKFAFPSATAGANDQTFRLVVRPGLWGRQVRLRLTNVFGIKPVTFDGVYVGLQMGGPALVKGTNRPVKFEDRDSVTVPPEKSVWSDPVELPFVHDSSAVELMGRKLAVSFHVASESGLMTWHAKALTTSFISPPGSGSKGASEDEAAFRLHAQLRGFFLDQSRCLCVGRQLCDRRLRPTHYRRHGFSLERRRSLPDVLLRRLQAIYGNRVAVVNAGIGGNQVVGPPEYGPQKPFPGRAVGTNAH